jgi:glutamate-1-semialdehyde aminotransferase
VICEPVQGRPASPAMEGFSDAAGDARHGIVLIFDRSLPPGPAAPRR